MLISFSGLDCSGKSTQINLLKEYLKGKGYNVKVVWSRGGYTPGVDLLKTIIRGGKSKAPEEQTAEERAAKVAREPKGGKILLWIGILDLIRYWGCTFRRWSSGKKDVLFCDRYFWDTYIDYQLKYPKSGFENWISWKLLTKVYRKPDLSLCLTVTPEESMRRSNLKFEPFPEPEEKREERLDRYMAELENGRWQHEIDCMRPIEPIQEEIRRLVDEIL